MSGVVGSAEERGWQNKRQKPKAEVHFICFVSFFPNFKQNEISSEKYQFQKKVKSFRSFQIST